MTEIFRENNKSSDLPSGFLYNLENLSLVKNSLPEILDHYQLNTVQEAIFCQCWLGVTYRDIAEQLGYDQSYIRLMGSQLWQLLSEALGQKVTKSNFQAILMRRVTEQHTASLLQSENSEIYAERGFGADVGEMEQYISRFPIETQCYETILQEGALIRIKAPQEMGKTLLMSKVLSHAHQHGLATVALSFRLADADTFSGLDKFLQWFCLNIGDQLNLPSQLPSAWENCFSGSYNCTNYIERFILPVADRSVAIALDDVDVLFQYPKIATDFFGMLRAWCEKAKHVNSSSQVWRRCRFIVVHSTEVYIPLNKHQSPFNIGLSVELPEFNATQVAELAGQFNIAVDSEDILKLMDWIGGKPKLLCLVLGWVAHQRTSLASLLMNPMHSNSLFQDHLRSQYRKLQRYLELQSSFEEIVLSDRSVAIAPVQGFQLESLGLVSLETGMRARPSCNLYRQYFRQIFNPE